MLVIGVGTATLAGTGGFGGVLRHVGLGPDGNPAPQATPSPGQARGRGPRGWRAPSPACPRRSRVVGVPISAKVTVNQVTTWWTRVPESMYPQANTTLNLCQVRTARGLGLARDPARPGAAGAGEYPLQRPQRWHCDERDRGRVGHVGGGGPGERQRGARQRGLRRRLPVRGLVARLPPGHRGDARLPRRRRAGGQGDSRALAAGERAQAPGPAHCRRRRGRHGAGYLLPAGPGPAGHGRDQGLDLLGFTVPQAVQPHGANPRSARSPALSAPSRPMSAPTPCPPGRLRGPSSRSTRPRRCPGSWSPARPR